MRGRAVAMVTFGVALLSARTAHAQVLIWQNGFESADTCAWTMTEPMATCDPEMVFVPAGLFTMGSGPFPGGIDGDNPAHTVNLSAYWIDRHDVTVGAYAACVTAGGCSAPNGSYPDYSTCNWASPRSSDNPINCVDWSQGLAYCAWAGKRYLTEAEWEKAARGTDARTYPWGEAFPTCSYVVMWDANLKIGGCGLNSTWPVASKPAGVSPYGALDMAGNVWQWLNDWYDDTYYSVSPVNNPPGPASSHSHLRVIRGGAWTYFFGLGYSLGLPSSERNYASSDGWYSDLIGFRCARDG